MKHTLLILLLAASTAAASAQTPAQPAASAAKTASPASTAAKSTAKPAATTGATAAKPAAAAAAKLPLGVPAPGLPPVKTLKKNLFTVALSYQDAVVGTGEEAVSGKQAQFKFTLYVASDGHKFDSSDDHPGPPLKDKDGKPVLGEDGKPKMGDPLPMKFILGQGRPLPGWDYGVAGMKVGGKRRIFIPWQLGFGEREIPARDAAHPATPAKSDLILDVELVDVADAPPPPQRPGMGAGMHPPMGAHPPVPGGPGAPPPTATPSVAPSASAAPKPAAPAAAAPAAAPAAPAATPSK